MINNIYTSVAQAKVNGVSDFYWSLNTGKRIEEFFSIMRSMRRENMNFCALDFWNRAADASLVQYICAVHPELDTTAQKLTSIADKKNTCSWKGDTKIANMNIVECGMVGREEVIVALRWSNIFTDEELNIDPVFKAEPGVTIFRPCSQTIEVLAGNMAEYNLADLSDFQDDEEIES